MRKGDNKPAAAPMIADPTSKPEQSNLTEQSNDSQVCKATQTNCFNACGILTFVVGLMVAWCPF